MGNKTVAALHIAKLPVINNLLFLCQVVLPVVLQHLPQPGLYAACPLTSTHCCVDELKGRRKRGNNVLLWHIIERQLQVPEMFGVAGLKFHTHLQQQHNQA